MSCSGDALKPLFIALIALSDVRLFGLARSSGHPVSVRESFLRSVNVLRQAYGHGVAKTNVSTLVESWSADAGLACVHETWMLLPGM